MDSLKDISSETIRKNWNEYKNIITSDSPYYDFLWNELEKKENIDKSDKFLILFKKFINNDEIDYIQRGVSISLKDDVMIIKGLNSGDRRDIHELCDKIGLHHESKTEGNNRLLYIYKPDIWLWEYSEKNPLSKPKYKKRNNKYCCVCNETDDLYVSPYIGGLYCGDCLNNESDGDGGTLSDHKFEPIY